MVVLVAALNLEIAVLSMNIGAKIKKSSALLILAIIFASFHCLFSCAGLTIGNALSNFVGALGRYIGCIILVVVGSEMARKAFVNPCSDLTQSNIFLVLFGAGTEDLAGGIIVGTFGGNIFLLIALFFIVSIPINLLAFRIGNAVIKHFNFSMDLITGLLLIAIGLLSAFGVV